MSTVVDRLAEILYADYESYMSQANAIMQEYPEMILDEVDSRIPETTLDIPEDLEYTYEEFLQAIVKVCQDAVMTVTF